MSETLSVAPAAFMAPEQACAMPVEDPNLAVSAQNYNRGHTLGIRGMVGIGLAGAMAIAGCGGHSKQADVIKVPKPREVAANCLDFSNANVTKNLNVYNTDAVLKNTGDILGNHALDVDTTADFVYGQFEKDGPLAGKGDINSLAIIEAALVVPSQIGISLSPSERSGTNTSYNYLSQYTQALGAFRDAEGGHTKEVQACKDALHVMRGDAAYNADWAQHGDKVYLLDPVRNEKTGAIIGFQGQNIVLGENGDEHKVLSGVEFTARSENDPGFPSVLLAAGGELYVKGVEEVQSGVSNNGNSLPKSAAKKATAEAKLPTSTTTSTSTTSTTPRGTTPNTTPGTVPQGTTPNTTPGTTPRGTTPNTTPGTVPQGTTPNTTPGTIPRGTTPNTTPGTTPRGTTPNTTPGTVPQGTTPNTTPGTIPRGTTPNTTPGTTPRGTTPNTTPGTIPVTTTPNRPTTTEYVVTTTVPKRTTTTGGPTTTETSRPTTTTPPTTETTHPTTTTPPTTETTHPTTTTPPTTETTHPTTTTPPTTETTHPTTTTPPTTETTHPTTTVPTTTTVPRTTTTPPPVTTTVPPQTTTTQKGPVTTGCTDPMDPECH